jgi:hypothetical protein
LTALVNSDGLFICSPIGGLFYFPKTFQGGNQSMSYGQIQINGFVDPNAGELVNLRAAKTLGEIAELKASGVADYNNFGALLTPQFEKEIADIARRRGVFGQLLMKNAVPAVGHPHRWFEQTGIPNNQGFTDPRNIAPTAANNGGTLRQEFAAFVRALTGQINFGLFDQQTVAQTSIFPQLVSKDLTDMIKGLLFTEDKAMFTGNATSLTDSSSTQYCSIPTQVTNTIQVNPGASIIDSIRTKIAQMMSNLQVQVRPTHIFVNPLLLDLIEQEIKNAATTMKMVPAGETEVVPGVVVPRIMTAAGPLPLVPAVEMPTRASTVNGATTDYPIFIASMDLIEYAYIGSPDVQVYKLGLVSDLADKYVAVKFATGPIVKAAAYAHAYGYVSR